METLTFLMTTTFYPPYHIGGDAVHVKDLAEELVKINHNVHVFHSLDAYKLKGGKIYEEGNENNKIHIHTVKSSLKTLDPLMVYLIGKSPFVRREYEKILNKVRPDVVHHHNISLLGSQILRKRSPKYLSLYTAHDFWFVCQRGDLLKYGKELCMNKSCLSCSLRSRRPPQLWRKASEFKKNISSLDSIIAPSEYMKNILCSRGLSREVRIECIPNFVSPPPKNIESSRRSGYFLYVGKLEKTKGVLGLLEVFKEIDRQLTIAGKGSLEKYLKNFITKNRLRNNIKYLGFVNHKKLYPLYKDALAVILPSTQENAPLTALEALSVGTPVIGSYKGGLPEIVGKIDEDLLFKTWGELKNILLHFDKERYPTSKIKQIYEKYFSPNNYLKNYIALISR